MIVFHHALDLQTPTAFGASKNDYVTANAAPPGTVTPWQLEDVQVLLEDQTFHLCRVVNLQARF